MERPFKYCPPWSCRNAFVLMGGHAASFELKSVSDTNPSREVGSGEIQKRLELHSKQCVNAQFKVHFCGSTFDVIVE
jgi:hypothetical protein